MKNKKIIITILVIIIISIIIIIIKNNYKKSNCGNNISNKTLDGVEDYIYNINAYDADVEIIVNSNKNTNKYKAKQIVNKDECVEELIEPKNIEGIKFIYKENKLIIENTALDLKKVYENYPYIAENEMFLTDFINKYKNAKNANNAEIEEDNEAIVFKIENKNNKYKKEELLYVNKSTGEPNKIVIKDNNKKDIIYILYNKIKINNL